MHQFDVHKRSAQVHAVAAENILLVFKVVAVLCYAFICQQFLEIFCAACRDETFQRSGSSNRYRNLLYFSEYAASVSLHYDGTLSILCGTVGDLLRVTDFNSYPFFLSWSAALNIAEILSERSEFILLEQVCRFRSVFPGNFHIICSNIQRNVCLDGYERMAEFYMILGIFKCLPLFRGELIYMSIYFSDAAVF